MLSRFAPGSEVAGSSGEGTWYSMSAMLQAIWHQNELHVWAINLPGEAAETPRRLREILGEWSSDALLASVAKESQLGLRLPQGDSALTVVQVPTLAFSAAEAVDLLASLPEVSPAACGDSVRYWRRLGVFVTSRLAARQFYPDVEQAAGEPSGIWRLAVCDGAELSWLEQFVEAMPPVCRAMGDAPPEQIEPHRLVESFLHTTADALIRRAVSEDPFFQNIHQRAAEPMAPMEVRWLSGLLGSQRGVPVSREQAAVLTEYVRVWTARMDEGRYTVPMRLCFTLLEPEDEATDWRLTFQLQSLDEEGQFVEAASLWEQGTQPPTILGRSLMDRRAQLVEELGRAAEAYLLVERVLSQAEPAGMLLSAIEAHAFLRHWGPQLAERGFGVFLPDWVARRDRELGLQLLVHPHEDPDDPNVRMPSGGGGTGSRPFELGSGRFGLDSLLDFDWQVAVGDLRMTREEFIRLAEQDQPLVRYQGRWLQMDIDAMQRAALFMASKPAGRMTLADAIRTTFTASKSDTGLPVVGITGTSWIEELLEQIPATRMQASLQPVGFQGLLRPYQLRGLDWLAFLDRLGIGACLADDMGLGKTIQLIALLLQEREKPSSSLGPTLLFAPTSVVGNWVREVERFAPSLRVLVHHGPQRLEGEALAEAANRHDLVITSYALSHRDLEDLRRVVWHRLALDEAQKIKNPSAASTLAIRSLSAPHRVALTGTPIENHLSELWSIMEILNPGLLGSAGEFRERFAVPIERLADRDRAGLLRKLIQPFVLRRVKTDPQIVGDLPEKMEMRVFCNLTAEQAGVYQRITDEMLGQIDSATGIRRRGLILAALTRLKQICDHPALLTKETTGLDGRSGKCERLVEMLEEVLEEGDAALVFTQYREMGHLLEKILAERLKVETLFLHGGVPARHRDAMVARFQCPTGGPKIFILSLRAGGLGLNLTAANHVFHFDRWWNPAVEQQATDRAHRIGQTRKVQVHKYVCLGTMEERIDRMLAEKMVLADQIVGTGDEWLTNLSTEELRKTLALSNDAVVEY